MKLLQQPNSWSCMPTSLAMFLNEDVENIIKEIGNDGSEIVRNWQSDPRRRKGFHPQQLMKVCLKRNKALLQFDTQPMIDDDMFPNDYKYIDELMKDNSGILLGIINGRDHAVAWNHIETCIYDPNGTIYAKGWFNIESFLMLKKLL